MKKHFVFMLVLLALPQLCQATIYRYRDANGKTMMTNTLPPEATELGYDILNDDGTVQETVPPPKTPEQIAEETRQQAEAAKAEQAREAQKLLDAQQKEQDRVLLQSFSAEEDLVRSRDEKIASIKVLQEITEQNIAHLEKKLQEIKEDIKIFEAKNQIIPEKVAAQLKATEQQLTDNQNFVANKKLEIENIRDKFQAMIERYRLLKAKEAPTTSE